MGLYDENGFDYHEGIVSTPLDCHVCSKNFIAKLDYDIDGNHKIICPYCGHKHWRKIKKGIVTGDRWGSGGTVECKTERSWTHKTMGMQTNTAAEHIRKKWGIV